MKKMPKLMKFMQHALWLRYVVVAAAGVALVGFVGENSILAHMNNKERISDLQKEIDEYRGQYETNMSKLRRLETDPKAIVEIARERYFMKADDEDIFVLRDDSQESTGNETTE